MCKLKYVLRTYFMLWWIINKKTKKNSRIGHLSPGLCSTVANMHMNICKAFYLNIIIVICIIKTLTSNGIKFT